MNTNRSDPAIGAEVEHNVASPVATVRIAEYAVNAVPEDACTDYYTWEVRVVFIGHDQWAVKRFGQVLDHRDRWIFYSSSTSRDEYAFTEAEALQRAQAIALTIVVNGTSVEDVLRRRDAT